MEVYEIQVRDLNTGDYRVSIHQNGNEIAVWGERVCLTLRQIKEFFEGHHIVMV